MPARRRLTAAGAAGAAVLAVAAWAVPAQARPLGPTPAASPSSTATTAPAGRFDPAGYTVLRPAAKPVKLTVSPRDLKVTYTFGGTTRTLADYLQRSGANGFLVLDQQKIVFEKYQGASASTRFQSWSMGKSFTSAAVGIALAERRIRSIDDKVTKYLPWLAGSGYDGVSIRDLLRMSSGVAWNEGKDVPKAQLAAHAGRSLRTMAARTRRAVQPGTEFEYTSMNSFVLAALITQVTGKPYHDYVEEKLWKPAGMAGTARVGNDGTDDLGYCCYYATDRDYARFGLLYLNKGKALDRQVVPKSWVAASTRPSASFNKGYGLHWWLGGDGGTDFMAAGFGGQYTYVSPEHGVVVVKSSIKADKGEKGEALAVFRAVAAEVARTR
ncbi:hypothetical protein Sru01_33810 [Sphaerisporangium rufum]|uniref:Beta-lactamase-related domain-containing protein n=1 Tax=Sphaerisporangium rufum TaxID=1381558 RepID=A0A919R2A5_9ACTN|nr:serine hydrolase domain-containing protein [Sphaerisporangium rufum]GII78399.1 hypothetical protein Sru01_33810 [Sphaerisporangium rufum]